VPLDPHKVPNVLAVELELLDAHVLPLVLALDLQFLVEEVVLPVV
jgi:hypothetical protein